MKTLKLLTLLLFLAIGTYAQSVTYTVTNGNASGAGSFQEAVDLINALSSPHDVTINFNGTFNLSSNSVLTINSTKFLSLTVNGNSSYVVLQFNDNFNTNTTITFDNLKGSIYNDGFDGGNYPTMYINNNSEINLSSYPGYFYLSSLSINSSKFWGDFFGVQSSFYANNSDITLNFGDFRGSVSIYNSYIQFPFTVNYYFQDYILIDNSFIGVNSQMQTYSYSSSTETACIVLNENLPFSNSICTIRNSYFLGNYKYGIHSTSSHTLILENNHFGHPTYASLGSPKIPVNLTEGGSLMLTDNTFNNSDIVVKSDNINTTVNLETTNQMLNCQNGIVIPNYTNSIGITTIDTAANTIGGTCNCNEVMVWKNGSPLSNKNATGESHIATVPCTGGNWSFTNTTNVLLTQLTFMERFNISNTFLNNKRTGTFSNWQNFDLGANFTKCPSRTVSLNANIFGSTNHVWNTGAITPTINATNEGMYKVTFLDFLGNERSDSVFIYNDTDIRQVDIGADSTICNGDSVRLISNVLSGVTYLWSNGKTTSSIYVKTEGWHKLTIKDSCNNISADSIYLTVNQNCGRITGRVFYDADSSCTFNGIDKAYRNLMVKATPGNHYTFTDANGNYQFLIPADDYTVQVITNSEWRVKCPSDTVYNLTLPANTIINNRNFSLLPKKGKADLEVHYTNGFARPLSPITYQLSYKNTGKLSSGSVQFTVPNLVNFTSSTPTATSVSGKTYTYNFTNLYPGETRFITINGNITTNTIGTALASCAVINPITTDYDSTNNRICKTETVRGAVDPNDKMVTPAGISQYGYIERKDSVLTYTVRFQNIGTDTAFNILITDTLSNQVNFETLSILESSHPCYLQQTKGGVLRFRFKNIKLPDSTTNQVKSNGFVTFRVRMKPNLNHGTAIYNNATIYFDTQAGLTTNTVTNTIMHYLPEINESNTIKCHYDTITLSANVTGGTYTWNTGDTTQQIQITSAGTYSYQFTDSLGFTAVSNAVQISNHPITANPVINVDNDTLQSSYQSSNYQWYYHNEAINGANSVILVSEPNGYYYLTVTDTYGCTYRSDSLLKLPQVYLNANGTIQICEGDSLLLNAISKNHYQYTWNTGDSISSIYANNEGTYFCVVTDSLGYSNQSNAVTLTYYPQSTLELNINGDTLFATDGFAYYSWYFNGTLLTVTSAQNYIIPQEDGDYRVEITETQGACITESEIVAFVVNGSKSVGSLQFSVNKLKVYPNPASSQLTVSSEQLANGEKIEIYNAVGVLVKNIPIPLRNIGTGSSKGDSKAVTETSVNISDLAKGIYLVKVGNESVKVVVE